jgi:hypothetical protein
MENLELKNNIASAMEKSEETEAYVARELAKVKVNAKWIENQSRIQDIEQRKQFADKIYKLVSVYLVIVGILIVLNACPICFHISDVILGTILGTTTANILAIFHFVAKYLFSEKHLYKADS